MTKATSAMVASLHGHQLQGGEAFCGATLLVTDHLTHVHTFEAGGGTVLKMTHQSFTPQLPPAKRGQVRYVAWQSWAESKHVRVGEPICCQPHNRMAGMSHQPEPWPGVAFGHRGKGEWGEEVTPPPHTHRSWVQFAGLSIRWPSFKSLKSSSTGIPGYGDPPNVKISHSSTPKDQLETKERSLKFNEFFFQVPPHIPSPPLGFISVQPCIANKVINSMTNCLGHFY